MFNNLLMALDTFRVVPGELLDIFRNPLVMADVEQLRALKDIPIECLRIDKVKPPSVYVDMTPVAIDGEDHYTRTQFAAAVGVTPQRVSQFLRYGYRGRRLRRTEISGKIYIPCTETTP